MGKIYSDISGMLLLDKPAGITSFKAVNKIKKVLNAKKTGHCGTLDPCATGLLLVLIGKATKSQNEFMKKDKVYTSSFVLGIVTDTGDLTGSVVCRKDIYDINIDKIREAAKCFVGEVSQIPPMYSALKYKGRKLYEFARCGIEIERKPRYITINKFDIISYSGGVVNVSVSCSSGTYIRSLAQDLGNALGCGAAVKTLRREQIDKFYVKDALKYKDYNDADKIMRKIIPLFEIEK